MLYLYLLDDCIGEEKKKEREGLEAHMICGRKCIYVRLTWSDGTPYLTCYYNLSSPASINVSQPNVSLKV